MLLEERAEIEQRLLEELLRLQQERDEQPADAAVAVEKRMDRLELIVNERQADQRREMRLGVQELLEQVERGVHLRDRRRDVRRLRDLRSRLPDPVLHRAELARGAAIAAHALHQLTVQLADEA